MPAKSAVNNARGEKGVSLAGGNRGTPSGWRGRGNVIAGRRMGTR